MEKKNNIKIKSNQNLVLKTLAMPKNQNVNGYIFGGWIMSQMDIGGAILAKEISGSKVSTVCVNNLSFLKPISVGDLVHCYAKCISIGKTSMTIKIEIWIKRILPFFFGSFYCTTQAIFIYVALDKNNKPKVLPKMTIL